MTREEEINKAANALGSKELKSLFITAAKWADDSNRYCEMFLILEEVLYIVRRDCKEALDKIRELKEKGE